MVVIIMTNAQMGTSCFQGNGIFDSNYSPKPVSSNGFSISRKPNFGVALNWKNTTKIRIFGLRMLNCGTISAFSKGEGDNRLVGGGVLEKDFEFKPSFDEYLKAMESIKEKKQARKLKRDNLKDNSSEKGGFRTQLAERDEENGKLGKIEGYPDGEKMSKVVEQDGNGVTSREGMVRSKFGYEKRGIKEFKDELNAVNGKESDKGVKERGRLRGEKVNGNVNPELGKGKSIYFRSVQRHGALNAVKKTVSDLGIKGGLGHDESSLKKLERTGAYSSQRGWERNTTEREKLRIKSSGAFGINPIQVKKVINKEIAPKDGKLTRSSKAFLKKGEDGGLETERAAFQKFDEFSDVVDKPRLSRMEMEERIQKLAKWLNGADIDMPEWMFSKMMRSAKIRFTDHSMLRVIQIFGKLGNWRRVLQVIEWLQMRERFKSHKLRYVYTAALDVLGKARRPVEALNVFHAMQQQMSSYPDLVAYRSIAVTLGQAGHMKELFDVIDSMRSSPKKKFKTGALEKWDPRLEPDIVVYNAVLNACVRRKQWEGAFWVLQQLKQQGQQPSTTTYGLVMEVMFACGKYNLVHEFFRKVQKSSIPNAITYRVLVNTLWREGKTDEAVLAVRDMESRGIVGSAALYYDLARCLCSAGRCQEALMQIDKICKVANKPLVVTYTGLIQACLDAGNIHNAAFIFNQMENFCSPNLVTCNIMLKAYLMHGMFKEANELFEKMSEDGSHISSKSDSSVQVIPDIYTFNIMLDACIAEKRWDDFECVYERMLRHGYHFNAKRHLRMILDASRAGKGVLLEKTWNHLAQADRVLPPSLIKEKFCMKLEKDDYAAALSSIATHQVSELQPFSKKAWLNLFKENAHRFQKDTLIRLIHEVSILNSRSDLPNPVLENLMTSCKEFFRTRMTEAKINLTETVCTV